LLPRPSPPRVRQAIGAVQTVLAQAGQLEPEEG
jgi:hypothetical protein